MQLTGLHQQHRTHLESALYWVPLQPNVSVFVDTIVQGLLGLVVADGAQASSGKLSRPGLGQGAGQDHAVRQI